MAENENRIKTPTAEYVVLERAASSSEGEPSIFWTEAWRGPANGTAHAIRQALGEREGGTYVAVPARSWKPVQVRSEPRPPKLVIG